MQLHQRNTQKENYIEVIMPPLEQVKRDKHNDVL